MATDSTYLQGNFILNWTDGDNDGLWDEGEGEKWYDWGLDQVPDSLEAFQAFAVISPNFYNNYVFDIEDGFLQEMPELVDTTVNLWISNIEKLDDDKLTIDISIQSNVSLKGLQFQLSHSPYARVDTVLQKYEPSIAQIGTEKLFEDLSLLSRNTYADEELKGKLLLEYANDVSTFLNFENLGVFLSDRGNIISHEYSNLILYVDSIRTHIYNNMEVYVVQENSSGEDIFLSTTINVSSLSDSIIFSIGHVLRAYQSGNLEPYNQLKLKSAGNFYNYSQLSFQNKVRLDVMYTK